MAHLGSRSARLSEQLGEEDGTIPRVIVALTMMEGRLVRTRRFGSPSYVGDPINTVRIFSEKGADELLLLDIGGEDLQPSALPFLADVAAEALMPIAYGGGIRTIDHIRSVIRSGFEKVVLNTVLHSTPSLATQAAEEFGSQAVIGSIDVRTGLLGRQSVRSRCGRQRTGADLIEHAKACEQAGCGEILLTSIDRDGSMRGYDLELVRRVASAVGVPVIALGGAGDRHDLEAALSAGASAVAAGSLFVYWGPRRAVLINYPDDCRW